MDTYTLTGARVFRPRPSRPWIFFVAMAAYALIGPVVLFVLGFTLRIPLLLLIGAFLLITPTVFLILAFWMERIAAHMRYELSDTTLTLIGGVHYTIPLNMIKKVYARDLSRFSRRVTGTSVVRVPGMALSVSSYSDLGVVRMVATSSWQNITVIETTNGNYGVTPAEQDEFISAVRQAAHIGPQGEPIPDEFSSPEEWTPIGGEDRASSS